jgi:hypothetical protein
MERDEKWFKELQLVYDKLESITKQECKITLEQFLIYYYELKYKIDENNIIKLTTKNK